MMETEEDAIVDANLGCGSHTEDQTMKRSCQNPSGVDPHVALGGAARAGPPLHTFFFLKKINLITLRSSRLCIG